VVVDDRRRFDDEASEEPELRAKIFSDAPPAPLVACVTSPSSVINVAWGRCDRPPTIGVFLIAFE